MMMSLTEAIVAVTMIFGHPQLAESEDFLCLAQAIHFEAGGESKAGKQAVASVIKNRATTNGTTYCIETHRKGQFSFWKTHRTKIKSRHINWSDPFARKKVLETISVAIGTYKNQLKTNVGRATHYLNRSIATDLSWAESGRFRRVATIGRHEFYVERG